jgi:basic amino acid/polyamine antiporter, APA family
VSEPPETKAPALQRSVGLGGAVLLGLGSILGTGVYVSLGIAAEQAGGAILLALLVAGLLATANGLSSAQLAATYPVSGGTYEYGHRTLGPKTGFAAGWLYLCAKSASAATAALGCSSYLLSLVGREGHWERVGLAAAIVLSVTTLAWRGLRRSNLGNALLVGISAGTLVLFMVLLAPKADFSALTFLPRGGESWQGFFEACALLFVAYTGYGRVATLGEEVTDPARTIPRAVGVTLLVSFLIYGGVAITALGAIGLGFGAGSGAPLEDVAKQAGPSWLAPALSVGATAAMVGVTLNLVLGLSRVALAMGRRGDLPAGLARLDAEGTSAPLAVWSVGLVITGLTLVGDVRLTWTFSAFTVLLYYAITNLSALRLPPEARRFPRLISWCGLAGCLGLAPWVPWRVYLAGGGVLLAGFIVRAMVRGSSSGPKKPTEGSGEEGPR